MSSTAPNTAAKASKVCPRPKAWIADSAGGDVNAKPAPSQIIPKRASKAKTDDEREYHALIAAMPCVICEALRMQQVGRTTVHHIRAGTGLSLKASHFLVLPLCEEHHQGKAGIHGNRTAFKQAKLTEMDCLALVIQRL